MTRNKTAFQGPPDDHRESLEPPERPVDPTVASGVQQEGNPAVDSMADMNVRVFYDKNESPLKELKKINHFILLSFQDLIGIISDGEDEADECLERLKHLFMNAHDLLHQLRQVQGYENMHQSLKNQNDRIEEFKRRFKKKLDKMAALRPP
jgi:hypothetical protein